MFCLTLTKRLAPDSAGLDHPALDSSLNSYCLFNKVEAPKQGPAAKGTSSSSATSVSGETESFDAARQAAGEPN
ncbi:hypothetical protein I307_06645 [Cryptococcus deuterogattii 99/473]|nr:hypothetical protein I307_06645 [Cryptococcus deuterogattii 99/473]